MLQLDHVLLGVRDLEAAAERLRIEHGLHAVPGGRHPAGTSNWIVPLEPPQYLELIAGAWVEKYVVDGDRLVDWCVLPDDIEAVAARLGLEVNTGSVERPDGTTMTYRFAMTDAEDGLPFFGVADEEPDVRRARFQRMFEAAGHPSGARRFAWIEIGADSDQVREWLGDELPVRVVDGERGVRAVGIATDDGPELVIR